MGGIKDGSFIGGDDLHSFLMIGQSNMAGRGNLADVEPINNFRCYMLRNGRFLRMSEPVNPDRAIFGKGFTSGVSLAASFADEFAKEYKARVGLIPCADGGTAIDKWQPGTVLFDNAVFMTKLAMRSSSFSGIIWHQGESDCTSDESLDAYKSKFVNFVDTIRRELGAENLPFIAGEISENISENWEIGDRATRFNRMLNGLVNEISHFGVASSNGLTLKDDGLHFTALSARELGKRYFEIYKKVR
ncbi:MAG: sialate O-acetylesterase [Ruminococcaceae bacterium]|nr:sialate O-acetylesterase [Oscillospiraceae bacterium]